jgi:hypothetical protein
MQRTFPGLSFSHFEAAAGAAEPLSLLSEASENGWTAHRLRREATIAAARHEGAKDQGVRRLGPQTLDDAIDYCAYLSASSDPPHGGPVSERLARLTGVLGELAEGSLLTVSTRKERT